MNNDQNGTGQSQEQLEAVLYVLNDPSLDRERFEDRLADSPELCEVVAEAVQWVANVRLSQFHSETKDPALNVVERDVSRHERASNSWFAISMMAASIALVGFFGIRIWNNRASSLEAVSKVINEDSSRDLARVVTAWSDLQSDLVEDSLSSPFDGSDSDFLSEGTESGDAQDIEVPGWLVTAMAAHSFVPKDGAVQ